MQNHEHIQTPAKRLNATYKSNSKPPITHPIRHHLRHIRRQALKRRQGAIVDGHTLNLQVRASVITPAYPGRWKKGQNDGNPCAYSEKPTSRRNFVGFLTFYRNFLYFPIFCYIFVGFPINGHPQVLKRGHYASISFLFFPIVRSCAFAHYFCRDSGDGINFASVFWTKNWDYIS